MKAEMNKNQGEIRTRQEETRSTISSILDELEETMKPDVSSRCKRNKIDNTLGHAGWNQMVLYCSPEELLFYLHLDDKDRTVFSVGQMQWQFVVMPFGLCSAPGIFERLMETVLRGVMTHILYTWLT